MSNDIKASDPTHLYEPCHACTIKHLSAALYYLSEASRRPLLPGHLRAYDSESSRGLLPSRNRVTFDAEVTLRRARILTVEAKRYQGLNFLAVGMLVEAERLLSCRATPEEAFYQSSFGKTSEEIVEDIRDVRVTLLPYERYDEAIIVLDKTLGGRMHGADEPEAIDAADLFCFVKEAAAHLLEALREFPKDTSLDKVYNQLRDKYEALSECVTHAGALLESAMDTDDDAWGLSYSIRNDIAELYRIVSEVQAAGLFATEEEV